ncbi:MAG: N-acetyltransferase family protein [Gemmatirosa sp.]
MSEVTNPRSAAVRRATTADAVVLAEFASRTFRETYAPPHGPCEPDDVAAYVATHFGPAVQGAELADPRTRVVLAEQDGAIAGYAFVRVDSRPDSADDYAPALEPDVALVAGATAELARLYVDRPWHGGGLAAVLLDAACAEAAADGAGALWFSVYQKNARAIAFYRKRGATAIATATFRMGREVQDDWIMAIPAVSAR